MEARKVIIVNNKTQSQKIIMSNATTLGELKAEARAAGINIEDMTWYEGHMRAELKDDSAPLPATVMWKGTETTDLTFLLTQPEKKVKSGAMSRAEAYSKIRAMSLGELCKARFGKNFTQVSTNDLIELINEAEAPKQECKCTQECNHDVASKNIPHPDQAFKMLVEALYYNDVLEYEQYTHILAVLNGEEYKAPEKMSQDEIDEMFNFVNR
jgi:hypothetical protein